MVSSSPSRQIAGPDGGGQGAPESIQAVVRHFENAADITWLRLVEKEIGIRSVLIDPPFPLEKPEGDERVEEVPRAARVQPEATLEGFEIRGMAGEFGEHLHFHGAEQRFGGPECEAGLKDAIGGWVHGRRMDTAVRFASG